jgi:hypothetical protein
MAMPETGLEYENVRSPFLNLRDLRVKLQASIFVGNPVAGLYIIVTARATDLFILSRLCLFHAQKTS